MAWALRQAFRRVSHAPALALLVVLTLAIGIGANAAIFSVVHALLIQPLPYRDSDRLAFIWGGGRGPLSGPDFRALRMETQTFADVGGIWASGTIALTGDGDPQQLRSALVTPNFFEVLGVDAALGRTFRPDDLVAGAEPGILIGWDLFSRRFGGDPSIVGRRIVVNDEPVTVIGVMPEQFRLLLPPDAAVPDRLQAWHLLWPEFEEGPRGNRFLRVVGRLRPEVSLEAARADVDAISRRIVGDQAVPVFTALALQADDVRDVRGPLLALFAGVGVLLTIACVNVGSLLIARAASQTRENSLRLALGATRGQLLRQWALEGLILTSGGAAAGVGLGYAGLRVLRAAAPDAITRIDASTMNLTVLGFTVGIAVAWGLLLSLTPAIELVRAGRSASNLLTGSRTIGAAAPLRHRTRAVLVVAQVALSLILLVSAALLFRTFAALQETDLGFRSEGRLTFRIGLPGNRYDDSRALEDVSRRLRERLSAIPGVTNVGAISHLPFDDMPNWALAYALPSDPEGTTRRADTRAVSAGLFETLEVRLIDGRLFNENEEGDTPALVIDDLLAARLWPDGRAVGRELLVGQAMPDSRAQVIGVVGHMRLRDPAADLSPQVFLSYDQWIRDPMAFVVRATADAGSITSAVQEAVSEVDARLPIYDVRPMEDYTAAALSVRRFTTVLAVGFATAALVLTGMGVYGLLAYTVAVRTHEFGVRRALGAGRWQVASAALNETLKLTAVGSIVGTIGAAGAAQLLESQLYAVHPRDPATYVLSASLLLAGAIVACWIPVRRATAVSPMDALRTE